VNERLLQLSDRISDELRELEHAARRAQEGWYRFKQSSDELYLDGVALNLHSFYGGLERLFELIATAVDGSLPQGANWHQILLEKMAKEFPGIRPAVISESTREALDEYRGFRHMVRHVYTFRFDVSKLQGLIEKVPKVFAQVQLELQAFVTFLKQYAISDDI